MKALEPLTEAADYCISAIMVIVKEEFAAQFIRELGDDPKIFHNLHYQAIYTAILTLYEKNEEIAPDKVWKAIESDPDLVKSVQGGINEILRLSKIVVEQTPEDVFDNHFHHCQIIRAEYNQRKKTSRALRISAAATLDSDEVILAEANQILAERDQPGEIVEAEDDIPFPDELLIDVFKPYVAAFQGKTEVPTAFHFAILKTVIGSSLGRRVYLDGVKPIYPNFYTVVIGETGLARKSTALRIGEDLLGSADPAVFVLRALATPEGLIQVFIPPAGYKLGSSVPNDIDEVQEKRFASESTSIILGEQLEGMLDNSKPGIEGFRILVSLDEFSHLLKKAGKTHGDGLIQMLTTAYDYPAKLDLPTRVNPIAADHPCLSLIGATTTAWLESSLKLEDIQGGFANRISYYLAKTHDAIFMTEPGNQAMLDIVAETINGFRHKYPEPTPFQFSRDSQHEGQLWYEKHLLSLKNEKNPLSQQAMARTDNHMRKAALLHAALENETGDREISTKSLHWAFRFADYLQAVTNHIYSKFNLSETRRLEQRITELLTQRPNLTAREITQRISWASTKDINAACRELVESGALGQETGGRTVRFYVLR